MIIMIEIAIEKDVTIQLTSPNLEELYTQKERSSPLIFPPPSTPIKDVHSAHPHAHKHFHLPRFHHKYMDH